jgi:hypothetical protein
MYRPIAQSYSDFRVQVPVPKGGMDTMDRRRGRAESAGREAVDPDRAQRSADNNKDGGATNRAIVAHSLPADPAAGTVPGAPPVLTEPFGITRAY